MSYFKSNKAERGFGGFNPDSYRDKIIGIKRIRFNPLDQRKSAF